MNPIRFIVLLICTFISFYSYGFNESSERVNELIKNSQKTRVNIEKKLTKRELASLKKNEGQLAEEFENLMKEDKKTNWFNEVDKLID